MYNIGLIGKARSGKDSAAAHLVRRHAYTRLAFADPLKAHALRINPLIEQERTQTGVYDWRLRELVELHGWEMVKDNFPEVRRLLQSIGQAQREHDEDYWVNVLRRSLNGAERLNMPVVVSDVRYRNEAEMLRSRGFRLVRIVRPTGRPLVTTAQHASETELDDFDADMTLTNAGSIEALHALIEAAV